MPQILWSSSSSYVKNVKNKTHKHCFDGFKLSFYETSLNLECQLGILIIADSTVRTDKKLYVHIIICKLRVPDLLEYIIFISLNIISKIVFVPPPSSIG